LQLSTPFVAYGLRVAHPAGPRSGKYLMFIVFLVSIVALGFEVDRARITLKIQELDS
jgi:hypothetical protein